jgi:PAS domain S-box-containing protein
MNHERGTLGYFQELFELAPAAYVVTDARLGITDANGAAAKLLRRPRDELLGKPLAMFIEASERAVFHRMVTESLIAKRQLVQPISLHPLRGEEVEVLYSACVVHDAEDNIIAIHWLFIEGFEGGQGELL